VFLPPVEHVLARVILGLRRATPEQGAVLDRAWGAVCDEAGVRADRYILLVQRSGALNATAGAGHVVGVTANALSLPPRQLQAVLAHELGHHLGGHAVIGLLHAWYGWPLRTVIRLVSALARVGTVAVALTRPLSAFLGLLALPLLAVSCAGQLLVVAVALPAAAATVVMRRSELRADATAVRLGYGAELLGLYRAWAAQEPPRPRGWRVVQAFLRDTHPRFEVRVRALERALAVT
jgi:Zn-dependent protease with chaperone function